MAGKLGIGNDTMVVAYDGVQTGMVVWALRYFGHRQAKFLEGGIGLFGRPP